MGFFKSLKKIIDKANHATNKVMKVVDPIGGRLKEYTEQKSQAKLTTLLGGDMEQPSGYDDLGGTSTSAISDESMQSAKDKKRNTAKQRRQGYSGGSTLLTSAEDEEQQLNKNTLLGM